MENTSLKKLYNLLVHDRKLEFKENYDNYKNFVEEVAKVRNNLKSNNKLSLKDDEVYENTEFINNKDASLDPYKSFMKKMIYEKKNGTSSIGASVLSEVNFDNFIKEEKTSGIFKEVVLDPSYENYLKLKNHWKESLGTEHHVRINRIIASCTTDVSYVIKKEIVFNVLEKLSGKRLIDIFEGENDWYSKNKFIVEQLKENLKGTEGIDDYWIAKFIWELYEYDVIFELKKQIVKYGSPGTGKTYTAKKEAKINFGVWKIKFDSDYKYEDHEELVQFHPSYSYEDFIEGLRPVLDDNNNSILKLQNGIFKQFCIKAGKWEVDIANIEGLNWNELRIKDVVKYKEKLKRGGNHWDYIFELNDHDQLISEVVPPYFFIIDEINRAELSRVFGELMYGLEYRGIEGKYKTQYSQLNDEETGMIRIGDGYKFFIPNNLYILATMNTIDRSIESFDFALRRRFSWQEVLPNIKLLNSHLKSKKGNDWTVLASNLEKLNKAIINEQLLGKDFQIGHAYLWDLPYSKDESVAYVRERIWVDSIKPLLEEYLRGTGREYDLVKEFSKSFGNG